VEPFIRPGPPNMGSVKCDRLIAQCPAYIASKAYMRANSWELWVRQCAGRRWTAQFGRQLMIALRKTGRRNHGALLGGLRSGPGYLRVARRGLVCEYITPRLEVR
jgi:hypothetical protein